MVPPAPTAGISVPQGIPGDRDNADILAEGPARQARRTPRKKAWVPGTPDLRQLEAVIRKNARQQGVDEDLVWAVMRNESGFNPLALSPKGAMGLMQLMPGTAAMLGVVDPYNVEQNVAGGVKYLRICLDYFDQDINLALAAYNAGPGNVTKHRGVPPFAETINYVVAVIKDVIARVRPRGQYRDPGDSVCGADSGRQGSGLNWRVPLPSWKIPLPQDKVGAPRWHVGVVSLKLRGQTLVSLSGKGAQNPKAHAAERKLSSL